MVKYTISIAVHNRLAFTRACLESVLANSVMGEVQIIVTDNASTDGTNAYLRSVLGSPPHRVLRAIENIGFGAAHNEALTMAAGEYFVVLNNDVTVCPEWLESMKWKINGGASLCGVKGACSEITPEIRGVPGKLEYVEGSCMMIRTEFARRFGLFDPIYRLAYMEDVDLSLRLREDGWHIEVADIPVIHHHGATASAVRAEGVDLDGYLMRNRAIFAQRWKSYLETRSFAPAVAKGPSRIVVKRNGALGDVILTTPVIKRLADEHYHSLQIVVETAYPDVFTGNPDVQFTAVEIETSASDLVIDLNGASELAPLQHIVDAYAAAAGLRLPIDKTPHLFFSDGGSEIVRGKNMLGMGRDDREPRLVLHPATGAWPGKTWGMDKFRDLSARLMTSGWKVVLVGENPGPQVPCSIDMRGRTSVRDLFAVIYLSDMFVGSDSGPLHVAAAFRKPIVGIFGCTEPKYILPHRDAVGVVARNVGCLGCRHWQMPPIFTGNCVRDRVMCMEDLTVDQVQDAVNALVQLDSQNRSSNISG